MAIIHGIVASQGGIDPALLPVGLKWYLQAYYDSANFPSLHFRGICRYGDLCYLLDSLSSSTTSLVTTSNIPTSPPSIDGTIFDLGLRAGRNVSIGKTTTSIRVLTFSDNDQFLRVISTSNGSTLIESLYDLNRTILNAKFSNNDTILYTLENVSGNCTIYRYNLGTARDLTTLNATPDAIYTINYPNTSQVFLDDFDISNDGTKLFLIGYDANRQRVYLYELSVSTAYNLNTATFLYQSPVNVAASNSGAEHCIAYYDTNDDILMSIYYSGDNWIQRWTRQ